MEIASEADKNLPRVVGQKKKKNNLNYTYVGMHFFPDDVS